MAEIYVIQSMSLSAFREENVIKSLHQQKKNNQRKMRRLSILYCFLSLLDKMDIFKIFNCVSNIAHYKSIGLNNYYVYMLPYACTVLYFYNKQM